MAARTMRQPPFVRFMVISFLVLWLIVAAFPFLWTLWGSFKVEGDFFSKADWANALTGPLTMVETGGQFTGDGYYGAWVQEAFWLAALNTLIVCVCVVTISLTFGTLGGYALSRSTYRYAFWFLLFALMFRAMPPITLVAGYLLPFFEWNLWGHLSTTIIVLVAINQPFTLWMLHSFFKNIPKDLDESAMVDGCTRFQAFRHVIIPVMWPGVITTGLFSFLLAYNDFAVTAMLLSKENQTMVPKIASFLGTTQTKGNVMFAVAAVVSVTAPLFVMVMVFQRQIVSGLTAGAVKGMSGALAAKKRQLKSYLDAFAHPDPAAFEAAVAENFVSDAAINIVHPFNEVAGAGAYMTRFLHPLMAAFAGLHRRDYIITAGTFEGADWVTCTGHWCGTFTGDWLGIPATGRLRPICVWESFTGSKRANSPKANIFLDLPELMMIAGVWPITDSPGEKRGFHRLPARPGDAGRAASRGRQPGAIRRKRRTGHRYAAGVGDRG